MSSDLSSSQAAIARVDVCGAGPGEYDMWDQLEAALADRHNRRYAELALIAEKDRDANRDWESRIKAAVGEGEIADIIEAFGKYQRQRDKDRDREEQANEAATSKWWSEISEYGEYQTDDAADQFWSDLCEFGYEQAEINCEARNSVITQAKQSRSAASQGYLGSLARKRLHDTSDDQPNQHQKEQQAGTRALRRTFGYIYGKIHRDRCLSSEDADSFVVNTIRKLAQRLANVLHSRKGSTKRDVSSAHNWLRPPKRHFMSRNDLLGDIGIA